MKNITIIGVGGAGNNVLNHFLHTNKNLNLKSIFIDSFEESIKHSNATMKFNTNEFDKLTNEIKNSDFIFIIAGVSSNVGSSYSFKLSEFAKNNNIPTMIIAITPFHREGPLRLKIAQENIQKLKTVSNFVVAISNQKLLDNLNKNTTLSDAFNKIHNFISDIILNILKIINSKNDNVNLNLSDINKILNKKGDNIVIPIKINTKNSALKAFKEIFNNPFFDFDINNIKSILVSIYINDNYPFIEIEEAMESVLFEIIENENIDFIFGENINNELKDNEIELTIIAKIKETNEM